MFLVIGSVPDISKEVVSAISTIEGQSLSSNTPSVTSGDVILYIAIQGICTDASSASISAHTLTMSTNTAVITTDDKISLSSGTSTISSGNTHSLSAGCCVNAGDDTHCFSAMSHGSDCLYFLHI